MKSKFPSSAWGHAISNVVALIRLRPSASHKYSLLQLVSGREPSLSHLKVISCGVYVPISPPQRIKMGPRRRLGIYVGFNSPSIIKYLEPLTGNVFTACFADCQFDETMFPILRGEIKKLDKQYVTWNSSQISFLDTRSGQCKLEVQNIIHLQQLANELPDAFTDTKRVTKSYIPALNAPSRIDIPETLNESNVCRKHGRPILANVERLQMRLMDVVTAYLYGSLDSDIYMKIPEGLKIPEACKSKPCEISSTKLMNGRSLDRELDPFRPKEHDEDILGPEIPYLSAIWALMYLDSNTPLDIAF
ncbi:hypothetical protein Tco_1383501 [Tanacetum coccineum]